jgi:hypothetical protein
MVEGRALVDEAVAAIECRIVPRGAAPGSREPSGGRAEEANEGCKTGR